ncbi:MAG: hemerythrin domain-containing protein [Acidimicrobiales bacterium]
MRTPPPDDLVALLEQDHREIAQRFEELEAAGESLRAELFWKLTDELVRHEVAEEMVVYPALREVPGGDDIARVRLAEQGVAEEDLARIEKLDPLTAEFTEALAKLKAEVLQHANEEEVQALPFLAGSASSVQMLELGRRYTAAKLSALSHPHPTVPGGSPARKIVGPVAALYDRIRDAAGLV